MSKTELKENIIISIVHSLSHCILYIDNLGSISNIVNHPELANCGP